AGHWKWNYAMLYAADEKAMKFVRDNTEPAQDEQ
ncbi:hypothetical protein A2U01_0051012, partial [Trifolium medium]|nr:hypothetical protein [Trifolium medium]